jgi:hypothetical protein
MQRGTMTATHATAAIERVRELGAGEHILDNLEQGCGAHLVRVIDFEGPVDDQLLTRAWQRLIRRGPILQTRIDRSGERRPFYVLDPSLMPELRVVERQRVDDWTRVFDHELNTPIAQDDGPPVRATLVASPTGSAKSC